MKPFIRCINIKHCETSCKRDATLCNALKIRWTWFYFVQWLLHACNKNIARLVDCEAWYTLQFRVQLVSQQNCETSCETNCIVWTYSAFKSVFHYSNLFAWSEFFLCLHRLSPVSITSALPALAKRILYFGLQTGMLDIRYVSVFICFASLTLLTLACEQALKLNWEPALMTNEFEYLRLKSWREILIGQLL
jgi:hypothetical protein